MVGIQMNGMQSQFRFRSCNIATRCIVIPVIFFIEQIHLNTKSLFLNTKVASPAGSAKTVLKMLTP